jgi:protein-S-isoprenylcysteine O-methyltransferase Ste14
MEFNNKPWNHQIDCTIYPFHWTIFSIISIINLGRSTRFGLSEESTVLKKHGVYKFSRNPMYVGFDLLTFSAIFFTCKGYIFLLGIYSIVIYHFIILSEEKFMGNRFGNEYTSYKEKTVRYLFFK